MFFIVIACLILFAVVALALGFMVVAIFTPGGINEIDVWKDEDF